MPIPIKPVHTLDLHAELFDIPVQNQAGLSEIQMQLLGMNNKPKKEAGKVSSRDMEILKTIESSITDVKTASNYSEVPHHITDSDLLYLKTAGMLTGHGRSVNLTEKAKLALRDYYLSTDNINEFRKARSKDKFDLQEAKNIKVSENQPKFRKVSTWLTSNKDSSLEFDVRFIANDNKSRTKGLMFAKPLEDLEVAFFEFDNPDCYSFWNKNVDFALSLAFLNNDMEIVDIKDLEEQSTKSVSPKSNSVKYVVEAKKGEFSKHNINIGDKFDLKNKKLIVIK